MKRKLLMLIVSLCLLMAHAVAQQITVTGKVTSAEDGLPVPGATVMIKGTKIAVQTSAEGTYSIAVTTGDVLQFSYLGLSPKELTVGTQTILNVVLQPDNKDLDEVVIVGYGTQRKANLTGAVSTVDTKFL